LPRECFCINLSDDKFYKIAYEVVHDNELSNIFNFSVVYDSFSQMKLRVKEYPDQGYRVVKAYF
jgi:hypothetical protein